eukprot:TRINITY_DN1579_c0_g1_i2.p1 TRINITY_DN1579_c0_g1~~TRINITY_DN1579_c0_g1_i2.p1  ORF type:complete len:194 (+),score=52.16 TRINITY_DN1579_c0_g1_i2:59-640(+)
MIATDSLPMPVHEVAAADAPCAPCPAAVVIEVQEFEEVVKDEEKGEEEAAVSAWGYSLLDCCATGGNVLCNVLCCGPCMSGMVQSALEGNPGTLDVAHCGDVVMLAAAGCFVSPLASLLAGWCSLSSFTCWQRGLIRKMHSIQGDPIGDACSSFFCTPCAITQQHVELSSRGTPPGTIFCRSPVIAQQGYARV